MKIRTGVSAVFCAAHKSREGKIHGHTWEILAWWDSGPETPCAVQKKKELEEYLSVFDHTVLADGLSWGEYLGKAILHGMQCCKVEVRRPLEGFYAVVER
jgi:hypothetical protein